MRKIKWITIGNICVLAVCALAVLIGMIVFHMEVMAYYLASILLVCVGVLNLVFIVIKEASVLSYDSKRYLPILHVGHVLVGVICYYISRHVGYYDKWLILYWIAYAIGILIPIGIYAFLQYKEKEKNKNSKNNSGPKVMVNHK